MTLPGTPALVQEEPRLVTAREVDDVAGAPLDDLDAPRVARGVEAEPLHHRRALVGARYDLRDAELRPEHARHFLEAPEPSEAELIKLDPADVLTTQEAATLLAPLIKPLPSYDEAVLQRRVVPR